MHDDKMAGYWQSSFSFAYNLMDWEKVQVKDNEKEKNQQYKAQQHILLD